MSALVQRDVRNSPAWGWLFTACTVLVSSGVESAEPTPAGIRFFESKIRPLLISKCVDCHGTDTQESELRLDTLSGMLRGGTSGPAIVPGKLDESLLIAAINYKDPHLQMPPDGKLSAEEIELLTEWVRQNAPHPDHGRDEPPQPLVGGIDLAAGRQHWAYQPVVRPEVPQHADSSWVKTPIDALLLQGLQERGLTPAPLADKRTLLRRATFDLTGLPPTPEELSAFLNDESPQAFEHVLDRLLASPQYGERWGRHWLDVARYADSNGLDENAAFVDAWRYRNYVIDAFNADKPFDQFVREQLAGDLLMPPEPDGNPDTSTPRDYSPLIATGFLTLGPKVLAEKDQVKMEMDIIDEQIDAIGQTFLGLTIACARCHDHKFDPIPTADYYALAGVLKSTKSMQSYQVIAKYNEHVLATAAEVARKAELDKQRQTAEGELKTLQDQAQAALKQQAAGDAGSSCEEQDQYPPETREQLETLRKKIEQLKADAPEIPTAMGVSEGTPTDLKIHVRGSHLTLGRLVPRGVLSVVEGPLTPEFNDQGSGRLQYANWLTSREHPLTSRVAVNRIWRWHFGEGLVSSTDNFGKLGSVPTYPQLLDWLAAEFMENGWSIKSLHKQIMLSSTWQMSTQADERNIAIDPTNEFQWRANVQRLEAESIRDAMLSVSGLLDPTPSQAVLSVPKWQLVFDHTSKDSTTYERFKRSIYLPVIRNNMYDAFALFDYTSPDVTTGSRATSTVAPQALFLMNSDIVLEAATAFADRLLQEAAHNDEARIRQMYLIAYGREPQPAETERLLGAIAEIQQSISTTENPAALHREAWIAVAQAVFASNEFIYVN